MTFFSPPKRESGERKALCRIFSAYLINVGRGKIVNEKDLVEALKNYQLAGAGKMQLI